MNYTEDKKEFLKETKKILELYDVLYDFTMDNVGRFLEFANQSTNNPIEDDGCKTLIEYDADFNKFQRLMVALQFVEDPTNEEMFTYLLYLFNKSVRQKQKENNKQNNVPVQKTK